MDELSSNRDIHNSYPNSCMPVTADYIVHSSKELNRRKIEFVFLRINFQKTIAYAVPKYCEMVEMKGSINSDKIFEELLFLSQIFTQYLYRQKL